jgi:hypothetical protein
MSKQKTIREWFEELPEPYRSQALINMNTGAENLITDSRAEALEMGFTWRDTVEGRGYWDSFYDSIDALPEPIEPKKPTNWWRTVFSVTLVLSFMLMVVFLILLDWRLAGHYALLMLVCYNSLEIIELKQNLK